MDNTKPAGEDILRVEHVSNYYSDNGLGILRNRKRSQVLQDVSLTIGKDEFFGLVGESGCGKSTLGNAILGLIPYEGKITVAGLEHGRVSRKEFTRHIQAVWIQVPRTNSQPKPK